MTLIKFKNDVPARTHERYPYFSDLFSDLFDTMLTPDIRRTSVPPVNIQENDDNFQLELAAPGLNKEDFKISVENDILTVSAEKKTETTGKNGKFTRKEYSYNSFMRSFTLPEAVEAEGISANYENGIMKLMLPKREEAKPKAPKEIKVS